MHDTDARTTEGDERPGDDNSLGRLLALSDGVFAIAMTLLALDLRLPDLGEHITDTQLRHALADGWHSYLAFVISFYLAANYWGIHRRAMREATTADARLVGRTLVVLLLVAALPFPSSVLAEYGHQPSALVLYSVFNLAAGLAVVRLLQGIPARDAEARAGELTGLLADMAVFVLCIPGAYVLGDNGPWLLLLLIVSGRLARRPGLIRSALARTDRRT
jgi:uncharacterized membrane protein